MKNHPSYLGVFLTFARNSLVRDMTFRTNFIIQLVSSMSWVVMNLGFYELIFRFTPMIGAGTGWEKWQFFTFIAITMLINSLVQAFFMPNAQEFSEMIRTGGLDFALLKPIDTQFLISLQRVNWASLGNFFMAIPLLVFFFWMMGSWPSFFQILLFLPYLICGVAILYSIMLSLAATSVWMGRNQTLYDFWFYITNFSRYPMEIYHGKYGDPLRVFFTYLIPVLIVVNVPAQVLVFPLSEQNWPLIGFALLAATLCIAASRFLFQRALLSYRSASS